ncbi:hypothetical protein KKF03_02165 [Patescibacteria group bacterium]|nr:hypothetical protein [Patescibacteria group bacterium]
MLSEQSPTTRLISRINHPKRVVGALRYRITNNPIRIDTIQHSLDAMRAFLEEDLL